MIEDEGIVLDMIEQLVSTSYDIYQIIKTIEQPASISTLREKVRKDKISAIY